MSDTNESPKQLMLGGRPISNNTDRPKRLTGLFWGSAGTGKTTLACTAPGRKLLINFDPDGPASVTEFKDVDVVDFSDPSTAITERFKNNNNPMGLADVIDSYDTIIIDSLTNVAHKALMAGITMTKGATIERPSPGAYGVRNALTLQLVKNVLALTSKHNKHCIFIAHEDSPVTDDENNIVYITLSLGGKLPEQAALDFSEVWHVADMGVGRDRRIAIRPSRKRKPMKTRMFQTTGDVEFDFVFDPDTQKGMRLSDWFEEWVETGAKLPLPKAKAAKK